MRRRIRIEIPLLLPEAIDQRDRCVTTLVDMLKAHPGVVSAHVRGWEGRTPQVCLHYDPVRVSLERLKEIAGMAGAEVAERYGHGVFALRAVTGEDAARRIERALTALPGVTAASLNLPAQRLRVEWDRTFTDVAVLQNAIQRMGYPLRPGPAEAGRPLEAPMPAPGWYAGNRELAWSIIAGLLLLAAWAGERWAGLAPLVAIGVYLLSYGFGAFDLVRHWLPTIRRGKVTFDIDLLMLLAAVGAAVIGAWSEGAFLLFLFSLAHAMEHYALDRARGAIRALAELAPQQARVLRGDGMVEVPVESVMVGEVVRVRPAERIPVDGTVQSGTSAVDQAPITGESVPVEKSPGDPVFAGTLNGAGALEVVTSRAAGDRTLDRVIKLVEEAQTQKAPTQEFTDRFESMFVPAVLVAALLLIVLPPTLFGWHWDASLYRGMALLVAASPCALALGTPATVLAGIAQAARRGVLIKGGAHLENLGTLRALALDKTGTLTRGEPEVTDLVPVEGTAAEELLRVAAALESRSQHPLAQAVVRRAQADALALPDAGDLQSVTARGVRGTVEGELVEIGSARLWEDQAVEIAPEVQAAVQSLQGGGRSTMMVRRGGRWLGVIGVADRPRAGVPDVLDRLRALGLQPLVMLTGDNTEVGRAVGAEVRVDEVRANLLPEDKVTAVRDLLQRHGQVAMVGDGVNDAPALAQSTVGIAMGGAGTAVALEAADVALMGDDLTRLPFVIGLSRQARRIIRQNLFLSLAVVALLILATATGRFGIGPAVSVHEGSTLLVIANSLRLLGYEE